MLAQIAGRVRERELRLFAVGCCLRIWHLLPQPDDGFREPLQRCQRLARDANHDAERAELYLAAAAATAAFAAAAVEHCGSDAEGFAAHAIYAASALTDIGYADDATTVWSLAADAAGADDATVGTSERTAQAKLARQVFGNPFRC
jgi:hypothetical protein